MDAYIYPNEKAYHEEVNSGDRWQPLELIEDLKAKAKAEGLWNLFLPEVSGLTNLEYAPDLEYGTPRIAPRPAWRPAIDESRDRLGAAIVATLNRPGA